MRTIEQMISQEVHYCVSGLVATLASGAGMVRHNFHGQNDLESLAEQACELASPILDYESAAREAGWIECQDGAPFFNEEANDHSGSLGWEALCDEHGIEPHESEVFEHWIVSDWLAEKLAAHGEKVDTDFAGMTVWARTTTGQAIYADLIAA